MENPYLPYELKEFQNFIRGEEILQLKNNTIPRGLVPLEWLFYSNDVSKNPKVTPNEAKVEDCNIGMEQEPKIIKLSTSLSSENRENYIKLMKYF